MGRRFWAVAAAVVSAVVASSGAALAAVGPVHRADAPVVRTGDPVVAVATQVTGPLPAGWVTATRRLVSGGRDRWYTVEQPARARGRIPLLVVLHGRDMTPGRLLALSRLAGPVGPAVIVAPAGWDESWNAGDCCGAAFAARVDDTTFLRTVVSRMVRTDPAVDPRRVYGVGFSNGGRMLYRLACQDPGLLRGFVAVEAVPVARCDRMSRIDVTVVAQQADPLLSVGPGAPLRTVGGFPEPNVDSVVARLSALESCPAAPTVVRAGLLVERSWLCRGGARLRYAWYPGGAHTWRQPTATTPGATDLVGQILGASLTARR